MGRQGSAGFEPWPQGDILQVAGIPGRDDRDVVKWCKLCVRVEEVGGVLLGASMDRSG